MARLRVYLSPPAAKVSILPRPHIAPITQHGSTFHPSICGSPSSSDFCRSLPSTCYAVLRHLCILGGARAEFASLLTKPSKVSGNVYEHCQCRPQGLVSAGSVPNPTRRIGGSGHLKSRDQAWVFMRALSWLPAGTCFCCGTARLCACIPRRAASCQQSL